MLFFSATLLLESDKNVVCPLFSTFFLHFFGSPYKPVEVLKINGFCVLIFCLIAKTSAYTRYVCRLTEFISH